jgi:Tfp pilus assembly protein PilF
MQGATQHYEKAVELDPDYGEAHYALSFMLTQFDVERGRKHFKKAMELGIPDERNLGPRFYPE